MKPHSAPLIAAVVIVTLTPAQTIPAWSDINSAIASEHPTRSPIKHLIVVVGENRSFDNVFGTYTPSDPTQKVWNLLSKGIVLNNGSPGPNFALAAQQRASSTTTFELSPGQTGPFGALPQPSTTFSALPAGPCILTSRFFPNDPLCTDVGLDPTSQGLLSVPGTGQPFDFLQFLPVPDCRYPSNLPNGPYSLVGASELNNCGQPFLFLVNAIRTTNYTDNTGDPVHRFYQMWQQSNCSAAHITADNPSGCKHDLYTWVAITMGWGRSTSKQRDGTVRIVPPTTDQDTFQGGVSMGFYNMAQGDFPFFLYLAQNYAISDNYHQPVMGGTGPNSQFMFTGDVYYFTDANGSPAVPRPELIENPNPQFGTDNFYTNDHFGDVDGGSTGVAFTNCSDHTQSGVKPIMDYLNALPYAPFNRGNCAPGIWYQVNNDYPYYNTDGSVISFSDTHAFPAGPTFSIGPQTIPTIGDALSRRRIPWKYYGGV